MSSASPNSDGEEENRPSKESRRRLDRADRGRNEGRRCGPARCAGGAGRRRRGQRPRPLQRARRRPAAARGGVARGDGRADTLPARPVRRARQAADGRGRKDRALPRSDHRHPPRGQVLDAQRQSSPPGAPQARRENGHRAAGAGSAGGVQDSRAQHREGAQPEREIAGDDPHGARARTRPSKEQQETAFAFEFEQPAFLTLGAAYEDRPRLSGGAYQSILRRIDEFLDEPMNDALKERVRRGKKVLKLDDAVSAVVEKLKAKGLTSSYLKPFVVARVNYTRFSKATSFDFDETMDKIIGSAQKFNTDRISQHDVAKAGGGGAPPEED